VSAADRARGSNRRPVYRLGAKPAQVGPASRAEVVDPALAQ